MEPKEPKEPNEFSCGFSNPVLHFCLGKSFHIDCSHYGLKLDYYYKKLLNKVETNLLSRNAQIWPSVGIEKSPAPKKCGIPNPLNIKFIPNAKIFEKWKKLEEQRNDGPKKKLGTPNPLKIE